MIAPTCIIEDAPLFLFTPSLEPIKYPAAIYFPQMTINRLMQLDTATKPLHRLRRTPSTVSTMSIAAHTKVSRRKKKSLLLHFFLDSDFPENYTFVSCNAACFKVNV
jgi:hypothetical protein